MKRHLRGVMTLRRFYCNILLSLHFLGKFGVSTRGKRACFWTVRGGNWRDRSKHESETSPVVNKRQYKLFVKIQNQIKYDSLESKQQ